jgi:putative spermidine/putrescine transport system permease protein
MGEDLSGSPVKRLVDDLGLAMMVALALVTLAYIVLPIVVSLAMSFDARNYLGPFPPRQLSFHWYVRFFSNEHFIIGFRTSLLIATIATGISACVGVMAAVAISQYEFRGKALLSSFFLSPLMVPAVVLGFGLVMFLGLLGMFDGFLRLLAGHVLITVPYTIRATLAGLTGIRPSLREAAMTLGANERQVFWDITFPLAKTGIAAGCVFAFAASLDDVAVSVFLYDPDTYTLPIALISYMRANFDLSVAAAAVFLAGITFALILILDRAIGLDKIMGQGIYRT